MNKEEREKIKQEQCDHEWVGNGTIAQKRFCPGHQYDDHIFSSIFCKKCGKIIIKEND